MPKRKRAEDELEEKLSRHQTEIFRMLKVAKGFERQRMAKRLRDPKSTPEKKVRIEKEIAVLKSLDLQSVATAHLCASLLRIKAVAESPKLPESVKNGVPKPDITEEERAALHNVTSGLYNQSKVREAVDKAVIDVCVTLRVPMPDKKGKQKKGDKKNDTKDTADSSESSKRAEQAQSIRPDDDSSSRDDEIAGRVEEEAEWNGFSDLDEGVGEDDSDDNDDEEVDEKEQKALDRFNDRLVDSDDEDNDGANEELDPMEITDNSASEDSDEESEIDEPASEEEESFSEVSEVSDEEEASESELEPESNSDSDSDSDLSTLAPPPKARKATKKATPGTTTTLPSLMGGYISGSESEASDIDVAPAARKNRRGQRARQAIWEKKFKEKAKHLEKEKSGRDAGWDLKRGAVDGAPKTPWKQGIKNPFGRRSATKDEDNANLVPLEPRKPKPPKKDNEGPLHPSWEARKKAKEQQATASFQGKRVVFD